MTIATAAFMGRTDCDVAIVGAGVCGLAAAGLLKRAGKNVRCLEARDRVGGRIFTVHDPLAPLAIELGAEFVHGRPPEIWRRIRTAGLLAYEHSSDAAFFHNGSIERRKPVAEIADRVLSKMAKSKRKHDEAFETYLRRSHQPRSVASWARIHVEGFNAAQEEIISAASLAEDADAAEKIEGDRVFRIPSGYDSVVLSLLRAIPDYESAVALNSAVHYVKWRRGSVEVHYRPAPGREETHVTCRQLLVTVPLGVLKTTTPATGAILFDPVPQAIFKAAAALESGHVYRVTFRFRESFWEENEKLRQVGFLISKDTPFVSWWTTYPVISPLLTGWSAGTSALQFDDSDPNHIAAEALASLAKILRRKIPRPEAMYFHNWQADPFSRGAYSYVPVGANRNALSLPVENTLFFAGEAASRNGQGGTVHGAIESGARAAELILKEKRANLATGLL